VGFDAIVARAKRGVREDFPLYVVTVASLTVAFLGLGTALLAVANLSAVRAHWGQSHRMTAYLSPDAAAEDVEHLRTVLSGLPSVAGIEHVTAAVARQRFLEESSLGADLAAMPPDVFPASLEVRFHPWAEPARMREIAERVAGFAPVQDVETYEGWFAKLATLVEAGRTVVWLMGLLVAVCVVSVVGNTIRLAVASRRNEIEILKMCGATDSFVRSPLVVEGALQGALAALSALLLLAFGFFLMRSQLDELLVPLAGMRTAFMPLSSVLLLLVGGALAGALGSALSIRKYLTV